MRYIFCYPEVAIERCSTILDVLQNFFYNVADLNLSKKDVWKTSYNQVGTLKAVTLLKMNSFG